MKRFYILTFVDLVKMGYNVSDVFMFDSIELAIKKMKEMYLQYCEQEDIDDPMATDSYDHEFSESGEFGNGFAYINGKYYWDIFNKDLEY